MAKKKTTEKALNIDNILFNCRDYLRAARNSGSFFEKRDMMLTLVFLRFIGEKYEDGIENLKQTLKEQGLDPEDENIRAAFFDDATFADGTYNLPPEARWSTIISTPAPQLNVALDTALQRLEEEDPQLKGCFVKGTFTARNLAANDIKKIVDEVNKISHKTFEEEKDLIGRVYEYFLMLENQKSYERGLDDLKLVCDAYIEDLRRQMPCEAIGPYIEERNEKNIDNAIDLFQGVNVDHVFTEPKRVAEDSENGSVVRTGQFAFNKVMKAHNTKLPIALREGPDCVVSNSYQVFEVTNTSKLLSKYLLLWLNRDETQRYGFKTICKSIEGSISTCYFRWFYRNAYCGNLSDLW